MDEPYVIARLRKNAQEQIRVALDTYRDVRLVDLRVTVELSQVSGVQSPTKKGLSLRVEMLPELIAALQQAEAKAIDLDWIGGLA